MIPIRDKHRLKRLLQNQGLRNQSPQTQNRWQKNQAVVTTASTKSESEVGAHQDHMFQGTEVIFGPCLTMLRSDRTVSDGTANEPENN